MSKLKYLRKPHGLVRKVLLAGVAALDALEVCVMRRKEGRDEELFRSDPAEALRQVAIVVTTFQERQESSCAPLLRELRSNGVSCPIIVVVNGALQQGYSPKRRSLFLSDICSLNDVNVVTFRSIVPLARMWNLGIQIAATEVCVVLNDDLWIRGDTVMGDIARLAEVAKTRGLATGNDSFSHFAISDECIAEVGWFDERFLGFGEEDGDYAWRYEEKYEARVPSVSLHCMGNLDDPSHQGVATSRGKFSLAARVFRDLKYQMGSGKISGRFGQPAEKLLAEQDPYPLWSLHSDLDSLLLMDEVSDLQSEFSDFLGWQVRPPQTPDNFDK